MKPNKIKQFVIQLVIAYVIIVVVKMLACMVFGEQLAVHSILASIETLTFALFTSLYISILPRSRMAKDDVIRHKKSCKGIAKPPWYVPIAAEKIPHPKGEKMPRVHLFTFLYAYVSVKACVLGKLKSKPFTSQPLPFRAYCHSSLSANTRQTLAVAWG